MDVIEVATRQCDACGAPTYVYADHPNWPAALAYCAHHGTEYLPGLRSRDAIITDNRDQIAP